MPKNPFAAPVRIPFTIVACAAAGAAAAWVASSPLLAMPGGPLPRCDGGSTRILYAVWLASTHAFGAYLHGRRGSRSLEPGAFGLGVWTLAMSTVVPGAFLMALFALPGRPWRTTSFDMMSPSLVPALLALPAVFAIGAADDADAPEPARALAALAACLVVPWSLGTSPVFAFGLVAALTLASVAIGVAARAARRHQGDVRVRLVREGALSYRAAPAARLVAVGAPAPTASSRGLGGTERAAGLVAALGGVQLLLCYASLP